MAARLRPPPGRAAFALLALAAALVLLGLAALPPAPPHLALAALPAAPRARARAGAPDAGLPGLAGLGAYYAPLGSLMAQAGRTGAADPAAAALAGARQELAADERRALASRLQAAKSRQAAIMDAESQRAARVRQWRQRQQSRRARAEERAQAEARKQADEAAMRHGGRLGSWLASGDRSVPAGAATPHGGAGRVRGAVSRSGERSGRGRGQRVEGVADLPSNWFMGGVALTGADWRRRLGDSVVEANIRTREKARKFQKLVSLSWGDSLLRSDGCCMSSSRFLSRARSLPVSVVRTRALCRRLSEPKPPRLVFSFVLSGVAVCWCSRRGGVRVSARCAVCLRGGGGG